MIFRLLPIFLLFALTAKTQPQLELEVAADGLDQPADITNAGDGRLFIVERPGRIRILDETGDLLPTPFLNIDGRVSPASGERGLLGLTFHPDYPQNGYFYVNYTDNNGDTRIARFSVQENNPNQADPESEQIILTIEQPYGNHNAGDLYFGPDGYLYIGMGDGGSGGDPQNFSQNRLSLLGKMLRIDVDGGDPYSIPPDNPFAQDDFTLDEIWALGLRNPWRFSFDRETGDMWMGDVGQNSWEEINFQPAGSEGGENYGWRCYEGYSPFNTSGCGPASEYTEPVHVYETGSSDGCSVTGGFVYRGQDFPGLYGKYVYTDFCSGKFWLLSPNADGSWRNTEVLNGDGGEYVSLGEDENGELYVAGLTTGRVYRLKAACTSPEQPGITGDAAICEAGETATLFAPDAPAGYTYQWYQDGQLWTETEGPSIEAPAPAAYQVRFRASSVGSCDSPLSVNWEVAQADFPDPLIVDNGSELSAPDTFEAYQWYLDGELLVGVESSSYTPSSSGNYQVEVTDEYGCTRRSEPLAIVQTVERLGLQKLQAMPIPFEEALDLQTKVRQPGRYLFSITDLSGKVLWSEEVDISSDWRAQIATNKWGRGVYFLVVERAGQRFAKKLVKQ